MGAGAIGIGNKPEGHESSRRVKRRRNALKHGLSAAVLVEDDTARLEQLIGWFAPHCKDKELWHAAKRAAEAWLYCERVSRARLGLIAAKTGPAQGPERCSPPGLTDRLTRYERRATKQLEAALEILQSLLQGSEQRAKVSAR